MSNCDEQTARYSDHTSTYYQECPRCNETRRTRIRELQEKIRTGYGPLHIDEFVYLVNRLNSEENEFRHTRVKTLYVRVKTTIYWGEVIVHTQAKCRECDYRIDRKMKQNLDLSVPDEMDEKEPWY